MSRVNASASEDAQQLLLRDARQVVLIFGKTGVGKTQTANRLLNENWTTGHFEATTLRPNLRLLRQSDVPALFDVSALFVDLMGIGEDRSKDEEYYPTYEQWCRKASIILWVVQADTRAFKRDEQFLLRLLPALTGLRRFIIALNKVDCLSTTGEPGCPSVDSAQPDSDILSAKIDDVFSLFHGALDGAVAFRKSDVIPYSAVTDWNFHSVRSLFFPGEPHRVEQTVRR